MKRVSYKDIGLKHTLSPFDDPVATLKPGESILLETEDATCGQVRNSGDRRDRDKAPYGNPVVGPVYVEGAEKGMTLAVSIDSIEPSIGQGSTYFSTFSDRYVPGSIILNFLGENFPREPKICTIEDGKVYFSDDIVLPYRPMVGTIGVAPHLEEESISTGVLPGVHGGNMDLPDVKPGNTIHLPVFHDGALLYLGDVHAIQGDGEISGTAVEMPAETVVEVDLIDEEVSGPRIDSEDEMMFASATIPGESLEDTVRKAFFDLSLWIEGNYDMDRFEALMLCCQIGRISIGNLWAVAAGIEKKYLK